MHASVLVIHGPESIKNEAICSEVHRRMKRRINRVHNRAELAFEHCRERHCFCGVNVAQTHKTFGAPQKMSISLPVHNSDQTLRDFLRFANPVSDGDRAQTNPGAVKNGNVTYSGFCTTSAQTLEALKTHLSFALGY